MAVRTSQVTSQTTLLQRLSAHVGRRVLIEAEGFSSEAGLLQQVNSPFIRVSGQYFVPRTLNQIVLLDVANPLPSTGLVVRTTYRGVFTARRRRIGRDYLELIEVRGDARRRILIPTTRVVGFERQ